MTVIAIGVLFTIVLPYWSMVGESPMQWRDGPESITVVENIAPTQPVTIIGFRYHALLVN
jgi:hypothetical protein